MLYFKNDSDKKRAEELKNSGKFVVINVSPNNIHLVDDFAPINTFHQFCIKCGQNIINTLASFAYNKVITLPTPLNKPLLPKILLFSKRWETV